MNMRYGQMDRRDLVDTLRDRDRAVEELQTEITLLEGIINDLKEELHYERHCVCNHTWACVRGAGPTSMASRQAEE